MHLDAYTRALAPGLIQKDIEQIIPLILARAANARRGLDQADGVESAFVTLLEVLENGLALVAEASPTGDPRFRLEKYTAEIVSFVVREYHTKDFDVSQVCKFS
jgi:squamous cell carcinoma antigen recognized by T-cells 3